MADNVATLESKDDVQSPAARWCAELDLAKKEFEKWSEDGAKVWKRYLDERKSASQTPVAAKKFNVLWSNVQTLLPNLYARTPKVQVERRFKDNDSVGLVSSQVLERGTDYEVKTHDFDEVMVSAVKDYLLPGRGVARVRYEPEFNKKVDSTGKEFDSLVGEAVRTHYVHWSDFRHSPARVWSEVRWVAFRSYLTKDECKARFGKELPLKYVPSVIEEEGKDKPEYQLFKKAEIWEIWDKESRKVLWLCKGYDGIIEEKDDPLGLTDFFPCPKPLYATLGTSCLVPRADFMLYKDQAEELDVVTNRISVLTDALKVVGVYDASCEEIQRMLLEGTENQMIPVLNWSALQREGGVEGVMAFMPIKEIAEVLIQLYGARDRILQEIYDITGISDIVRGAATNPYETAKSQQIKGQFATLRISMRQEEVQRFARDLIRLQAEIIGEKFQPETLRAISGYDWLTGVDPQNEDAWNQVVELLRSDPQRGFRIDIETDSTLAANEAAEKEARNEMLIAVGDFLQRMVGIAQQAPAFAQVAGEMLKFSLRTYRAGRQLESSIEQGIQSWIEQMNQPPQEPPPDPKIVIAQMDLEFKNRQLEFEGQKLQFQKQIEMQKAQMDQQTEVQKIGVEAEKVRGELQLEYQKLAIEAQKPSLEGMENGVGGAKPGGSVELNIVTDKPKAPRKFVFFDGPNGERIAQEVITEEVM